MQMRYLNLFCRHQEYSMLIGMMEALWKSLHEITILPRQNTLILMRRLVKE